MSFLSFSENFNYNTEMDFHSNDNILLNFSDKNFSHIDENDWRETYFRTLR